MNRLQRLDAFRREVNWNLACGPLSEVELPVTDAGGGCPVVVALEDESLSIVLGRLRAVGGYANLFVGGKDQSVRMASVIDQTCAIADADDDMSEPGDRPDPSATVGMFLDYVERNPNGVTIAAALGHPALARDAQSVEFAGR